ncbi:cupin domain-containing protein [bacterium]|nr:MAG: cupin domain-containing protein [bacterium]
MTPPDSSAEVAASPIVDLLRLSLAAEAAGPQWGLETEDLNSTLLMWNAGEGVGEHVNDEIDVIMIGIEGEGTVVLDGIALSLSAGQAVLLPKGVKRSVTASTQRFSYLNVHRRRRKLQVGTMPPRKPSEPIG